MNEKFPGIGAAGVNDKKKVREMDATFLLFHFHFLKTGDLLLVFKSSSLSRPGGNGHKDADRFPGVDSTTYIYIRNEAKRREGMRERAEND